MIQSRRSVRLIPESEAWAQLIEDIYGDELQKEPRIEYDPDTLETEHLKSLLAGLPDGIQIERITQPLGAKVQRRLHPQIFDGYASADDFLRSGVGFCAIRDAEPICCVTTSFTFRKDAKINLEFQSNQLDFDIALPTCAAVLLECIALGISPRWRNVRNPESRLARLADRLGYADGEVYESFGRVSDQQRLT